MPTPTLLPRQLRTSLQQLAVGHLHGAGRGVAADRSESEQEHDEHRSLRRRASAVRDHRFDFDVVHVGDAETRERKGH